MLLPVPLEKWVRKEWEDRVMIALDYRTYYQSFGGTMGKTKGTWDRFYGIDSGGDAAEYLVRSRQLPADGFERMNITEYCAV